MMADHFVDDEAQEFLGEVGVQLRVERKLAQAGDLFFLAARVGGGQGVGRLIFAHRLRDLESLRQHENQRRVDIVDALPVALQRLVQGRLRRFARLFAGYGRAGKLFRLPNAFCIATSASI